MATLSHDRRTWMPAYGITIASITTVLLGIRLFSRFQGSSGRLGLDDLCLVVGWALATVAIAFALLCATRWGYDRHIWDVPEELYAKAWKAGWIISILFLTSTSFTKVSILLFYRRLVQHTFSTRLRVAIWAAIGFVIIYTIIFTVFLLTECFPLDAQWNQLNPNYTKKYHCVSTNAQILQGRISGGFMVFTDFYSVTLPAILIFRLSMTKWQRIALVLIFGVGYLVVAAGIVRTIYLSRLEGFADLDKTWLGFNTFVSGIAEGNIGIVCACVPSLKRFFGQWFQDRSTGAGSESEGWSGTGSESNGRGKKPPMSATPHSNFNGRSVLISTASEEPYDSYPMTLSQSSKGEPLTEVHEENDFYNAHP